MKLITIATPSGYTVEGSSAELIPELLERFFGCMEAAGSPVRSLLAPGLPPEVVRDRLGEVGLSAPDELVAWYSVFDGILASAGPLNAPPFPTFQLHSLDVALALYEREHEVMGVGHEIWNWNPRWLRIGSPVHSLAVRCSDEVDEPVLVRAVGDDRNTQVENPSYQVVSLCTPVQWWIEAIDHGLFSWDSGNQRWRHHPTSDYSMERRLTQLV